MLLDSTMIVKTASILVFGVVIYLIKTYWIRGGAKKEASRPLSYGNDTKEPDVKDAYTAITPLPNLDLATTPPLKFRPFKPKYHLTMALESMTLSSLLEMDNTYHTRISLRRHLLATQGHEVLAHRPASHAAVMELYTWLTMTYLPTRFPTLFTLDPSTSSLKNNLTHESLPLRPHTPDLALSLLGANIDTDFLVLLPSPDPHDKGKYRLEAFITCFPNGFSTRAKLGLLLAEIHAPVPGYKAKLEKSMDRFFAALPSGKVVRRANWAVGVGGDLFCLRGSHMSEHEYLSGIETGTGEGVEKVDIKKAVVRCERQTLHRLERTGALVFAFKTYEYPLQEIRDEGTGDILAEAIDGLATGNVPDMAIYKRQVVWGERVKAFLRGEVEG